MSEPIGGELWPHFVPLWADLMGIAPEIKLAGGYGLFLKQQWLLSPRDDRPRTLVPIERWREDRPRVTKDIDLIVDVDLIASRDEQEDLQRVLGAHGFEVVPGNARWQFEKKLGRDRSVLVDFHAPPPEPSRKDVKAQARRVKPNPSMKQIGIHGRENFQAVCAELFPFTFLLAGLMIVLPNPVTLAFMKIAAARDQYHAARDAEKTAEQRETANGQAQKHAADLFRIVAMITREENDGIPSVLHDARSADAFREAQETFGELFGSIDSWGIRVAGSNWREEDSELIQRELSQWFS